jgi:hypothetical protein
LSLCTTRIDVDIPQVNSSRQDVPPMRTPKNALIAIVVILVAMAIVALYANVQRFRRNKLETVIVTPAATPSPSAAGKGD